MRVFYITLLLIAAAAADVSAKGVFSVGFQAGAANDAGCVEQVAGKINLDMRSSAGTDVTEIETTYAPVFSVNLTYINGSLFAKGSWEYSTNLLYNPAGSFDSGGGTNEVEINFTRHTFPFSLGVTVPVTSSQRIYFAGGVNLSYVLMKVKQSDPAASSLTDYPSGAHTFPAYVSGTHLRFGGEIDAGQSSSFVFEVTRYFGNSKRVTSEDGNADAMLSVNSFEITGGVNYRFDPDF